MVNRQYESLLTLISKNGDYKKDRTGTGTKSIFGVQMRFDLQDGFPLITTKKVNIKPIIYELLWFLSGDINIKYLNDNGVHIWDEWADEKGDLGPIYGEQWRSWLGIDKNIDQIAEVIEQIKTNPFSRRLIVSAWNPAELHEMKLPPCHILFQFNCRELSYDERVAWALRTYGAVIINESSLDRENVPKYYLDCQLYQRSGDMFLGIPFNIASYSLLTMMVAQVTNCVPGEFIHTIGDAHIYMNHMDQVKTQLERNPYQFPIMEIDFSIKNIDDFKYESFKLINYKHHSALKGDVSI